MVSQINVHVCRFNRVLAFALKQNIKQNLKKNKITFKKKWVFFVKFKYFKEGGGVVSERDRQCNDGIGKRVHVYKC